MSKKYIDQKQREIFTPATTVSGTVGEMKSKEDPRDFKVVSNESEKHYKSKKVSGNKIIIKLRP